MFELVLIIGHQMVQPTYSPRYHRTLEACQEAGLREIMARVRMHKIGVGYRCDYQAKRGN